ncbi:MAG: SprT-like domain-containing protein [Cyclobacteriaceae bacterium]|nr:SprT-like domain-containing protein [Cyclobacteriaceae bacterium]
MTEEEQLEQDAIKFNAILLKKVPEEALDYCMDFWLNYRFYFTLYKNRKSKLGDYRFHPEKKTHHITVNSTLNKYSFLITYLHEVAHMTANIKYGRKIQPHGMEWKNEFRDILRPILKNTVLPEKILKALERYSKNPKASTYSDQKLVLALRAYDKNSGSLLLGDLSPGQKFRFRKDEFLLESHRRTKVLCLNNSNGRKYLISKLAEIEIVT